MTKVPVLEGDALSAVSHRGSHVQIIASAGSGKTEVVSQRVVSLLAEGHSAKEIVAFTFTERAAKELKNRIAERLEGISGIEAVDQLSGLYVGTIHGFCFQYLQQNVPKYETYDVIDESQHVAFLSREANHLGLKALSPNGRLYESIDLFIRGIQVLENEMLDENLMPEPFSGIMKKYFEALEKYRLLTFGQQITRCVASLKNSELMKIDGISIKHLIVDEYQDVNPAQEELIRLLVDSGAHLTVVGDDDQAIYQWRGSTVQNIIDFKDRYQGVETFTLDTNRRSLPQIIETASRFALTIDNRLDKMMKNWRIPEENLAIEQIVAWAAETEQEEANEIAQQIANLHAAGLAYKDIGILVRGRSSFPRILEALEKLHIPVQPGGRTGLFEQHEARCFAKMICWGVEYEWRDKKNVSTKITVEDLLDEFVRVFSLNKKDALSLEIWLTEWKSQLSNTKRVANLIAEFYEILEILNVREWDLSDSVSVNRMGTLARITNLFIDYESVTKRARPDDENDGEQVGGQDRGIWFYRNLAVFILNYANGDFDAFEGEDALNLDAVELTTVHSSKGLEWKAVFIPSLTSNRFPSTYSGRAQEWLVPRTLFDASRYEGTGDDERRLFYVAMTRARDWLSVSRHNKVTKGKVKESPYFMSVARYYVQPSEIQIPKLMSSQVEESNLLISYSDLAAFMECGLSYRLRQRLGFKPQSDPAIGYGKSIHHVMRVVANYTQANGLTPTPMVLNEILDREFYLPNANKVAHRELKNAARKLVGKYITEYGADLNRVWQTEYPFELHLPGVTVSGRADVIIDNGSEGKNSLTLIDYKTRTSLDSEHDIQLQIYANAGRREGLEISDAFVHDMINSERIAVDITKNSLIDAEKTVVNAAEKIKKREFEPSPEKGKCSRCDVRFICKATKANS